MRVEGFIWRKTVKINMRQIETVDVDQTVLGRLLTTGTCGSWARAQLTSHCTPLIGRLSFATRSQRDDTFGCIRLKSKAKPKPR
jgi:hypothetical protein